MRKGLTLCHVAVPSFPRSLGPVYLPNSRDSSKEPRTSRAPKTSPTHTKNHSLADNMNRARASPGESKGRKPSHLAGAEEHEDGGSKKASTVPYLQQWKPSENDGAIDADAIEIGDEDGEYSEVGSDEEIWPVFSQNSIPSTPSNSDKSGNPLPLNDTIFDYSTQDAEELSIFLNDLSSDRVKPDAVSWFNARFTRNEKSHYGPVANSESRASIVGRSRCLLPIERQLEDDGDVPIAYSIRQSTKPESANRLSRSSKPASSMKAVTRRKAKVPGKRKAILIKELSSSGSPVSSHNSPTPFQTMFEPTFPSTPGLSYPQPLLPEYQSNSHDTAPFLFIGSPSPLNVAIPEPLVNDQNVLFSMDPSYHGAQEGFDLFLGPIYNSFMEDDDPVARRFPDAEPSVLPSGLWEVQRCF